ncbi:MAG: MFS transporter [Armatimonadetes bacterium]|nr:MFS transporter [Armatimonadota bacterium]
MVRYGRLGALVLGHFLTDCYMGMVLPLVPIIQERFGLSLAATGLIAVVTSVTGSLVQPFLGILSDLTRRSYLVGLGVMLTGVGICTFGLAGTFWGMMVLIALGGLGCGAFHPPGSALASAAGGERRDLTQALFSPGGILGYSLGPVLGMALYQARGLEGMWPGMLVGLVAGPLVGLASRGLESRHGDAHATPPPPTHRNGEPMSRRYRMGALSVLTAVVFLRSASVIVFLTYLARLLEDRGMPKPNQAWVIMAFVFAGGLAGIAGGHLARVMGRRWLTVLSLGLAGPELLGFLHTHGLPSWAMLVVGGAAVQAAVPVNIVQAQLLLPRHQSLASALMMGFCWGAGAFLAPAFGRLADVTSLPFSLSLSCVLPFLGAGLALFVPDLVTPRPVRAVVEPVPLPPPPLSEDEEG